MLGALDVVAVTIELPESSLEQLRKTFKTVHYHPDGNVPRKVLADVNVWFNPYYTLPDGVTLADVPNTRMVQLNAAGANYAIGQPVWQDPKAKEQMVICTASGIHAYTIPQFVIAQIINLYMATHTQMEMLRTAKAWPAKTELVKAARGVAGPSIGHRSLRGKTAGLLGYGHIAREVARLLKAFHVEVIAANTEGQAKVDEGYILPGTGDLEGTLPSAYYSTRDPASMKEFMSRSDIVVASLPSTPSTRFMLNQSHFDALPDGAVFVNVGRGDLVKSEVLLEALDKTGGLVGAALDVTDPEPLPPNHPLFSHPRVIVTPHNCGDMEGYNEKACELLISSIEGIRAGKPPMNQVDLHKGY